MRIIDLEAHFYTQEYLEYFRRRKETPREEVQGNSILVYWSDKVVIPHSFEFESRLLDLGEKRIAAMDAAGISIQALSLSAPGCEQFEPAIGTDLARRTNDELALAVQKYPDRFIGLAALAPQDPQAAAAELERAVRKLGFKGVKLNSHVCNDYLDDQKYWPIFEMAEKLEVPIYLHPGLPSTQILKPYEKYGISLAGPSFGFAADTSLHVMRLIYSGVFDRYPGLKIILGHLGEGLPFWLYRIDFTWTKAYVDSKVRPSIARKPSEYFKSNFMVTTSGMTYFPAFMCTLLALGTDKIAFASDHPFEDIREVVKPVAELPISDTDKEKILHVNAEKLFAIK